MTTTLLFSAVSAASKSRTIDYFREQRRRQFTDLVLLDEHVAAQVVQEVIHAGLVARQRVVIIEPVDLHLLQVQLVAGEHAERVDVLRQLFRCANK